jgi:hypothetical protein
MRHLITLLILGLVAWGGYRHFNAADTQQLTPMRAHAAPVRSAPASARVLPANPQGFTCDSRTHCSQMRSCAEATYFIRKCPNAEMDGDGDGVPCESQWCG